jgi:hypothetical protein
VEPTPAQTDRIQSSSVFSALAACTDRFQIRQNPEKNSDRFSCFLQKRDFEKRGSFDRCMVLAQVQYAATYALIGEQRFATVMDGFERASADAGAIVLAHPSSQAPKDSLDVDDHPPRGSV